MYTNYDRLKCTKLIKDCAKTCVEFGEDCEAFSWKEEDKICILRADWLSTETEGHENTWSGHKCDLSRKHFPQTPRDGMYPAGEVLVKPIPPTTQAPTTKDPSIHVCDTQVCSLLNT